MTEQEQHFHDPDNVTNPEHAEHHIVSPMQYGFVYISLLIGTALTVIAANIDMGVFNPIAMLTPCESRSTFPFIFSLNGKSSNSLAQS